MQQIIGLGVWAVSFGTAFLLSLGLVIIAFDTTFERYGNSWFILTVVSLGFMILIPLDWLLGTKIMPD